MRKEPENRVESEIGRKVPSVEEFLNKEYFLANVFPLMEAFRGELYQIAGEEGGEVKHLRSLDELDLKLRSLSEMRICNFILEEAPNPPQSFDFVKGNVILDGPRTGSNLTKGQHVCFISDDGKKMICPTFGSWFWFESNCFEPGERVERLKEIAPELVYEVGEGCGVLYGDRIEIEEKLGLRFDSWIDHMRKRFQEVR